MDLTGSDPVSAGFRRPSGPCQLCFGNSAHVSMQQRWLRLEKQCIKSREEENDKKKAKLTSLFFSVAYSLFLPCLFRPS